MRLNQPHVVSVASYLRLNYSEAREYGKKEDILAILELSSSQSRIDIHTNNLTKTSTNNLQIHLADSTP